MIRWLIALGSLLFGATSVAGSTIWFDDPLQSRQWYLRDMNFGGAWSQIQDRELVGRVRVAVIDTGFDQNHSDLRRNLLGGRNVVDRSRNLDPVHPHGTATIGPVAASSGNGIGISRAAWASEVMPIRVTNRSDGVAYTRHIT